MQSRERLEGGPWRRIRKRVFDRDFWRCQQCARPGRLEAHHVDHNRANNDMDNLLTLCRDCHINHHRPKRTPDEEEWHSFVNELLDRIIQ